MGLRQHPGRRAMRRINQMHGMYDISNDDMRYVLSTFVVVPKRWIDEFGWRPLTRPTRRRRTALLRRLGKRMGIKDIPETYAGFEQLLDDYEAEHFAFDEGGRSVADSTLGLVKTFYARPARRGVEVFSRALMDPPLLEAFGYRRRRGGWSPPPGPP